MEREVPKRPIFTPTLSTIMVQWVLCWERQKRFSSCKCQGTWQRNATLIFLNRKLFFHQTLSLLLGKKGRRPNIVKNPKLPYLKKISTSTFWCMHCMVTSLGPRPSVGPKALKIYPLEMWPWSFPMSKGLVSWSKFMVTITWSNSLKIYILKAFGPLTRCKPNMDQGKWPCTKKWLFQFLQYMSPKANFGNFLYVWPYPPSSSFPSLQLWKIFSNKNKNK